MLPPQRRQVSFLMATTPEQMVPADHPLMQVREKIDFSFVREETRDLYSAGHGRPAYPPEQLFKILLLELWMNLSDVQVCQQLHYNLLYRAFCGIGVERSGARRFDAGAFPGPAGCGTLSPAVSARDGSAEGARPAEQ